MPSTSDFKRGVRFLYEGSPFQVTDVAFQTPSARGANTLVKVKARDLVTGQLKSFTFRAGEHMQDPDIEIRKAQFLYRDGETFHLMDVDNYEQIELSEELVSDAASYLHEELAVRVMFFEDRPISVEVPKAVELKVVHCDPGVKGDTATSVTKTAKLQTGLEIQVPLFINEGDVVRVDTADARYIERARTR